MQQVLHVRCAAFGMHQGGMGNEAGRRGRQRLASGEDAEGIARKRRRHQHHGRFVEVLLAAGGNAQPGRADPGHPGPVLLQRGKDSFRGQRVVVAQVAPAERQRRRVV
ncbi:hypothetical protein D3C81_1260010 [compost metagenome]